MTNIQQLLSQRWSIMGWLFSITIIVICRLVYNKVYWGAHCLCVCVGYVPFLCVKYNPFWSVSSPSCGWSYGWNKFILCPDVPDANIFGLSSSITFSVSCSYMLCIRDVHFTYNNKTFVFRFVEKLQSNNK